MAEIIQHQDPEEGQSNITGNGSPPPSSEDENGARSQTNQPATRRAIGLPIDSGSP